MSANQPLGNEPLGHNTPGVDSPGSTGAGSAARETADWKALKGDVEGIADVAVERGRSFVDAARAHATSYVDQRKGDAARSVTDLAKSVRDSSKTFDDKPNIRAFFDSAADGLEHLGHSIEQRNFSEFYEDAEAFARRAPVAVAVATFVTGFMVARFIKSTSAAPLPDAPADYRTDYRA